MANIKSAKKRINVINKKTVVNKARKTALKTAEKKFLVALEEGNLEQATTLLKDVEAKLMQAASKNTIHKNAASRKISRLQRRLNAAAE